MEDVCNYCGKSESVDGEFEVLLSPQQVGQFVSIWNVFKVLVCLCHLLEVCVSDVFV